MLKIIGTVPFKNNKERKRIFHKLREEYGVECKIWVEDNLLFYKYKADPDTFYF